MFKKLFGKSKEPDPKIPEEWDSFFCRIEDKPVSIRLNLALKNIAPIKGFSEQVWFSIKFQHADKNGFNTREEFETICAIDDAIIKALGGDFIFAGTVKTDGRMDFYFYTSSTDGVDQKINEVMKQFDDYKYAVDIKKDENWDSYLKFLYPGPYEFQSILNNRVIWQLEKNGDKFEKERNVDHWVYFKNEKGVNDFIDEIEKRGFEVLKKAKSDDKGYQYVLNIVRMDKVGYGQVDAYVWELCQLAEKNNGRYDGWGCPVEK